MPQVYVVARMGLSRAAVGKWWHRWQVEGDAGLVDWSSDPYRSPKCTPEQVEKKICARQCGEQLGLKRLATRVGIPASTVYRVLTRHRLNRLAWISWSTGERVCRYEKLHRHHTATGYTPLAASTTSLNITKSG